MIPNVIHYCWFGRGKKPKLAERCIESWRKYCPDYRIIEWNEDNFDIGMNPYTRMCHREKKYAFSATIPDWWSWNGTAGSILIRMWN